MPRFTELSGWWERDARVVVPSGKCRHGVGGSEGQICKQSLLKGAPFWLREHQREKLPPPFTLPYLGGWAKADGIAAWARFHVLGMKPLERLDFLAAHKELKQSKQREAA